MIILSRVQASLSYERFQSENESKKITKSVLQASHSRDHMGTHSKESSILIMIGMIWQ